MTRAECVAKLRDQAQFLTMIAAKIEAGEDVSLWVWMSDMPIQTQFDEDQVEVKEETAA